MGIATVSIEKITKQIEDDLVLHKGEGGWVEMGGPKSGHYGHKGRPGKRGGSLPSKGRGLTSKKLSAPVSNIGVLGNAQVDSWLNENLEDFFWEEANEGERSELKAQVARNLAAASGVTEQEAADFVGQWAHTSNDEDMRSLAIQRDAAKEFGVKTSEFTQQKIDKTMETRENFAITMRTLEGEYTDYPSNFKPLMESDKQRAILRSMYNETQAELKARGITEVRLSRGVMLTRTDLYYDQIVSIETNALESWSISPRVASTFASAYEGKIGYLFEAVIPAERILSIPATGFGALTEGEVIVLGGVEGDQVVVKDMHG